MVRLLIRTLINLVTSAVALLLAQWLIPGVTLTASGFVVAVAIFTVAQSLFSPWVFNVARKHASMLLGGIGIISTLLALILASLWPGGLSIDGIASWIVASLLVWFVTALGGWALVLIFITRPDARRAAARSTEAAARRVEERAAKRKGA